MGGKKNKSSRGKPADPSIVGFWNGSQSGTAPSTSANHYTVAELQRTIGLAVTLNPDVLNGWSNTLDPEGGGEPVRGPHTFVQIARGRDHGIWLPLTTTEGNPAFWPITNGNRAGVHRFFHRALYYHPEQAWLIPDTEIIAAASGIDLAPRNNRNVFVLSCPRLAMLSPRAGGHAAGW